MPKRVEMYCTSCGSTNVLRDAWAQWDAETQRWVLAGVLDQGYCEICEGESRLEEREIRSDYQVRHDLHGWYICTEAEGRYEDEGHPSVGFDMRPHYDTLASAEEAMRKLPVHKLPEVAPS